MKSQLSILTNAIILYFGFICGIYLYSLAVVAFIQEVATTRNIEIRDSLSTPKPTSPDPSPDAIPEFKPQGGTSTDIGIADSTTGVAHAGSGEGKEVTDASAISGESPRVSPPGGIEE
ncbi:hypothetical protein PSN45_002011 [Yamadazyma tenuis]|uniref:uncharacterized protein n=1 Tax=Candida tenuis TaxID=2315449 RepID=UPI0027A55C65|nr:hypothetical protein PSN45_002011 [Yamadazyma tenuis]